MGELAAWHAGAILSRIPFAEAPPDPVKDNPYPEEPPAPASEAQARVAKWKKGLRWAAFAAGAGRGGRNR